MCFVKFVTCHIKRFAVKKNVRNPNSVWGMRNFHENPANSRCVENGWSARVCGLPGRFDLTTLLQDFSVAAFA